MKVAYAYGRASVEKRVLTLEAQEQDCQTAFQQRYAKEFTFGGFFKEAAEHGDTPWNQRPLAAELSKRLHKGDVVIVTSVDRCFRDFADCFQVLADWHKRQIVLFPIEIGCDTSTDEGLMIVQIRASVAQYELAQIKRRTKRVLKHVKEMRGFTNQFPGYGWKLMGPQGKRYRMPCEEERAQMREIVRLHDQEGWSLERVYLHFFRTGVKTPGRRVWSWVPSKEIFAPKYIPGKPWSYDRVKRAYIVAKKDPKILEIPSPPSVSKETG